MFIYFLKRLLLTLPTLFGISLIVFLLIQILPGGPVETLMQQMRQSGSESGGVGTVINEELKEELKKQFGYDKPIVIRYFLWVKDVATFQFGTSYTYREPVIEVISRYLPVSLSFGIWSFILVYLLSIPLGIKKALKDGSSFDVISSGLLLVSYSLPPFALGLLLIIIFGGQLGWFPIQGLHSEDIEEYNWFVYILDYLHHIFLPLSCYVIGQFASLTFLMKNSFLEQIKQDYVKTAFAKGLSAKIVYNKHVLRNALLPIATGLGGFLNLFLAGSLLLEVVFGLEGIGLLSYEATLARDYPIALAIIMLGAFASVIGKILSDLLYIIINPRIDFES